VAGPIPPMEAGVALASQRARREPPVYGLRRRTGGPPVRRRGMWTGHWSCANLPGGTQTYKPQKHPYHSGSLTPLSARDCAAGPATYTLPTSRPSPAHDALGLPRKPCNGVSVGGVAAAQLVLRGASRLREGRGQAMPRTTYDRRSRARAKQAAQDSGL
jgi:hypothetical protein